MHACYVRLHKLKSGQAAKKLTDRDKYIVQKCAFYEGELSHRTSADMKPMSLEVQPDVAEVAFEAGSEVGAAPEERGQEDIMEAEGLLSHIERSAAQTSKSTNRPSKKRRQDAEEADLLRGIRDSMRTNTQLLSRLVGDKSTSPREPFIICLTHSPLNLPEQRYQTMMTKIPLPLIQNPQTTAETYSPADLSILQPANPRPRDTESTPARTLYQPSSQCQQPRRPYFSQYQSTPVSTQPIPPQYQPAQPSTSNATEQPVHPKERFSQVLQDTHEVMDTSLNLSFSGLGDVSVPSMSFLDTSPALVSSTAVSTTQDPN